MESAERFAERWNKYVERTSQLTLSGIYKPQFDKLVKMISERDEAIRNERVRLKEHVPNPFEFLYDFGNGG